VVHDQYDMMVQRGASALCASLRGEYLCSGPSVEGPSEPVLPVRVPSGQAIAVVSSVANCWNMEVVSQVPYAAIGLGRSFSCFACYVGSNLNHCWGVVPHFIEKRVQPDVGSREAQGF
jgi:hypothetical protein